MSLHQISMLQLGTNTRLCRQLLLIYQEREGTCGGRGFVGRRGWDPPICAARGSSLSCWGVGWKRCRRTWARPGRPLTGSHHWAGELLWWGQSAELALGCPTPREGFGTPHPPAAPHPGVEEPVPTCPHVPWTRVHPGLDYAHEHGDPSPKAPGMLLLLHPSALGGLQGQAQGSGDTAGKTGMHGGGGDITSGSVDSQEDMGTCEGSPGTCTGLGRAHPASRCWGCRKGDTVPICSVSPHSGALDVPGAPAAPASPHGLGFTPPSPALLSTPMWRIRARSWGARSPITVCMY